MTTSKTDHTLAVLEEAADRAHLSSFAKAHVTRKDKTLLASTLNRCIEAAADLERFLGHAAADAKDPGIHRTLYDAAKTVGDLPAALRSALESIDALVETTGTTRGAFRRAALEARVAARGRNDRLVLDEVERAFLHALAAYDDALAALTKAPPGFVELVVAQRKAVSHLHRELSKLTVRV